MTKPLPPETLARLRQSAAVDGAAYSQVLLQLLERVEALEAANHFVEVPKMVPTPEAAPVATDQELNNLFEATAMTWGEALRASYNLGRQHGAAQLTAQPGCIVRGSDAVVTAELEKMVELEKAAEAQPPAAQPMLCRCPRPGR